MAPGRVDTRETKVVSYGRTRPCVPDALNREQNPKFTEGTLVAFVESVAWQTVALTAIDVLKNPIGEGGLAALVTAAKLSRVGSICGLERGQTLPKAPQWQHRDTLYG